MFSSRQRKIIQAVLGNDEEGQRLLDELEQRWERERKEEETNEQTERKPTRFLLISVTGGPLAEPIEIKSLDELLAYLDYDGDQNDLIISKMSLVSKTHDRKQRKAGCEYVLCLYDNFIEERSVVVEKERKGNG